jgi:hypothetical protein
MKALKSLICLMQCAAMLCACTAPATQTDNTQTETQSQTQPTVDRSTPLSDGKTLKLLAITSSFGLNTTQLLYDIAVAEGCTDVVIGRLYASGCTLEKHVNWSKNNEPGYIYTKNNSGKWETTESATMQHGLEDEDWDIIFIQQSAAQAGQIDSYSNYIDQLMEHVQANKTNPNARFIWNMTWAYQADSDQAVFKDKFNNDQMYMYECILNATKEKLLPRTDFHSIIPTGTAIQNARTSFIGDALTKDTYHLNSLGRAIAGYTLFSTLTGKPLTEVNLTNITKVMSYDTEVHLLTDREKEVIIESVNNALDDPFNVTQSIYTTAE